VTESSRLRIEWEWEAAPLIKAPELRATFARLRIFVDDDCVTLVEDRESASSRRSIACSLYPLAEWIAYNWWFLQANNRPASALSAFRSRRELPPKVRRQWQLHGVRGAGDGFLWPDLFVLPDEPGTRLLWRSDRLVPDSPDRWPIRFLTQGEAVIDPIELQQTLVGFVESVIERLTDCGVGDTRLTEEWTAIKEADAEEAAYCRAAARLGLDPYSEAAKYEGEILRAAREMAPGILSAFLDSVSPEKMAEDLDWIVAAQNEIAQLSGPTDGTLEALRPEIVHDIERLRRTAPWGPGYTGARAVRRAIGLSPVDPFDFGAYVSKAVVPAPDRTLHALGGGRADAAPSVVLGRHQHEDSERFTLARAMWHFLRQPQEQFLITSAHTARQKAERAFAAELLAPAEGVAKLIGDNPDDIGIDELEMAERHFHVSSLIIQHQIDNQLTYA
jgi:IrrE N-terminal-like domain